MIRCAYCGEPGGEVRVHFSPAKSKPLPLRLDLVQHSPDGFAWGYEGSGPAQLALAILAFHAGDRIALEYHQDFKRAVIARWPQNEPLRLGGLVVDGWLAGVHRVEEAQR